MKMNKKIIFLLAVTIIQSDAAATQYTWTNLIEHAQSGVAKFANNTRVALCMLEGMFRAPKLNKVVTIYNDPSVTRFGSRQPLSNEADPRNRDHRATDWHPSLDNRVEGTSVSIDDKPIYYKIYLPKKEDLKAIIFHVYGGVTPRRDYTYGWYNEIRVLASQGYGVVVLSLSDVQDESFPRQDLFEEKHINQIVNETKVFIAHKFKDIRATDYEDILIHAQTVPHFLMGHSYGGLLTLLCATNKDFLEITNLAGFIAQAAPSYYFEPKSDTDGPKAVIRSEKLKGLIEHLSVIRNVSCIKKPILLMHSHYDTRVPLDHALRFYAAAGEAKKDDLVSLCIDRHQTPHGGMSQLNHTFAGTSEHVDRNVSIISEFICARGLTDEKLRSSKQQATRWNYAYPLNDTETGVAHGAIKDTYEAQFYRDAVGQLEKITHSERNDNLELSITLWFSARTPIAESMFRQLGKMNAARSNQVMNPEKFKTKFYRRLSQSIELSEEALRNMFDYVAVKYYDQNMNIPNLMTWKFPEHKDTFMQAYIDTCIKDFPFVFGDAASDELRKSTQEGANENDKQEYGAKLKEIFGLYTPADDLPIQHLIKRDTSFFLKYVNGAPKFMVNALIWLRGHSLNVLTILGFNAK